MSTAQRIATANEIWDVRTLKQQRVLMIIMASSRQSKYRPLQLLLLSGNSKGMLVLTRNVRRLLAEWASPLPIALRRWYVRWENMSRRTLLLRCSHPAGSFGGMADMLFPGPFGAHAWLTQVFIMQTIYSQSNYYEHYTLETVTVHCCH